jgi:hypothetical protein
LERHLAVAVALDSFFEEGIHVDAQHQTVSIFGSRAARWLSGVRVGADL